MMAGTAMDLSGCTYGRLSVECRAPNLGRRTRWRCRCSCGAAVLVLSHNLIRGMSRSCGCGRRSLRLDEALVLRATGLTWPQVAERIAPRYPDWVPDPIQLARGAYDRRKAAERRQARLGGGDVL